MKLALLDQKQKVQRWLGDKDIIEAQFDEAINSSGQLMFSVPISKGLDQSIMYVAVARPQGSGYVLFKIVKPQVMSDRVQYTAIEAAYDELKSYAVIRDVRPQNRTAGEMLALALMDTRWTVGVTYTKGASSTNFYYITPLEAIQKIAGIFSLEVTFEIDIDRRTNQITRRRVNLYAQQGDRTGKRFEYGSNLLTVTREENTEDLITALIGRGKGEEVSEGGDDSPNGYGRRITFADVVWSKKNGNPADKPAGIEYVEDVEATKAYGFSDGKPRIGIQVFEEITDPAELLQATWSALQSLKRPQVSFKADVLDVGELKLGDTVAIIRHDIGIEYFTRVYKVTHNLLNERLNTIELGDDFSSRSITSTIASMSGAIEKVKEKAGYAATSANGKNTNFYSQDKPAYATEGDLWYKDLGNGETDLYQYHDGNWILISSTRELNQAKKEIDQQLDNLKQLEKDKGIDIDAIKKNMKSIEDTANQAFRNGETNRTDLTKLDGEITGRVTQVLTNGGYATQSWTQGQFKLNNDSFNVQIGNVLKTANGNADKIAELNIDLAGIQNTVATKVDNTTMTTYVEQQWDSWKVEVDKKITDGTSNLMSKINVEAGSILFQSKKLFLAGESTVFGGSAFIPDAAISNLSADKITAGTLNAGLINVINLNASNITTGTINGANLKIDLNNGEVQFKRGRITSVANTLNIDIDTGTMSVTDGVNNGVYFANGELKLMDDPLNITGTPKYGGLRRSAHIWSPGSAGAELHSPNGVFVGSDNYNGAFAGGSGIDGTSSGAALAVDKDGSATLNGANIVSVSGGRAYDIGYSMKNRPAIILGKSQSGWNPGDRTFIQGAFVHIESAYRNTNGASPNVYVAPDGALVRSTSASKYKTDIQRSYVSDYGERLLELPTATWMDKAETERYVDGESQDKPVRHFGMIAEDLADAGLEMLVSRGQDGELEGIQYDRIGPALIPVIKQLQDKVNKLEEKLNEQ
ncbi:hypothetical protein HC014_08050 [Limosilactobacillus fermentum]